MSTHDVQIALGILQLVALTLPVFALLTQVVFSTEDNRTHVSLGITVLFGGGMLIIGGVLSAQSLYFDTTSSSIEMSLMAVSLGIVSIAALLYRIYDTLRRNAVTETRSELDYIDKMVELMEENEIETISEFYDSDIDIQEADRIKDEEETTLDDLKESRESMRGVAEYFEQGIIENTRSKVLLIFILCSTSLVVLARVIPWINLSPVVAIFITITVVLLMEVADRAEII